MLNLRTLRTSKTGASLLEYGLLSGLVGAAAIAAVVGLVGGMSKTPVAAETAIVSAMNNGTARNDGSEAERGGAVLSGVAGDSGSSATFSSISYPVLWIASGITDIDPTEGNNITENAATLVGRTFGSANVPVHKSIVPLALSADSNRNGRMEPDNFKTLEFYRFNGNTSNVYTNPADAFLTALATITYNDGTIAQNTLNLATIKRGTSIRDLLVLPPTSYNDAAVALQAKPINSIRIDAIVANNLSNIERNRLVLNFKKP